MLEENIENITKSDSNFEPTFVEHHLLSDLNFNWHCLINIVSIRKKVNLCISYKLNPQFRNLNIDFTLGNCLFGSVKLTKNADLEKYKYTSYCIGFDSLSEFSLPDDRMGKKSLFLELIWANLCILIIRKRYINSWRRTNTRIRWYYINSRSYIPY